MPVKSVTAVFMPPANVTLAPLAGARNVTVAPITGFPLPSVILATRGAANPLLITVVCGAPLTAVMPVCGQLFTRLKALTVPIPVAKSHPRVALKAG